MGKIRAFFKSKSIKKAFTIYMFVGVVSAFLFSLVLSNLCQFGCSEVYEKYEIQFGVQGQDMRMEFEKQGENEPDSTLFYQTPYDLFGKFSPEDFRIYNILGFLSIGVYPVCFIIVIVVTSIVLYRRQLQKPFVILDHAAAQIADNNLDFHVVYEREDELGKLCASFEKMRQALQENNEEMWQQMEERRRLNAAFSHDLRTPLTVLKGQSELLMQYAPKMTAEKVSRTSEMMHQHIARLEAYVQTMGDLQRLEDVEITRQPITLGELWEQFRQTAEAVCGEKEFSCVLIGEQEISLNIDTAIVPQVFENLLANAVRYAKKKTAVSVESRDRYLYLTVSDDGDGFAKKDLENATKPFYKAVNETDNEHFGMGLSICKILCEKHGGYLRLENKKGAVVTAVFRQ